MAFVDCDVFVFLFFFLFVCFFFFFFFHFVFGPCRIRIWGSRQRSELIVVSGSLDDNFGAEFVGFVLLGLHPALCGRKDSSVWPYGNLSAFCFRAQNPPWQRDFASE